MNATFFFSFLSMFSCSYILLILIHREGPGVSCGLNWALAVRGVIVKDKAYHNLKSSDLQRNGATAAGGNFIASLPSSI